MYGQLTDPMRRALEPIVTGRRVWDLGALQLGYSKILLELGAASVVAVDKEWMSDPPPLIETRQMLFRELLWQVQAEDAELDVVFVSWPVNRPLPGLVGLLARAKTVIYLGNNLDGSACGNASLFLSLCNRALEVHIPNKRNSMLVYGAEAERAAPLTPEEIGAFSPRVLSFQSAVTMSKQVMDISTAHYPLLGVSHV